MWPDTCRKATSARNLLAQSGPVASNHQIQGDISCIACWTSITVKLTLIKLSIFGPVDSSFQTRSMLHILTRQSARGSPKAASLCKSKAVQAGLPRRYATRVRGGAATGKGDARADRGDAQAKEARYARTHKGFVRSTAAPHHLPRRWQAGRRRHRRGTSRWACAPRLRRAPPTRARQSRASGPASPPRPAQANLSSPRVRGEGP
jgi:hypothetical protein